MVMMLAIGFIPSRPCPAEEAMAMLDGRGGICNDKVSSSLDQLLRAKISKGSHSMEEAFGTDDRPRRTEEDCKS